MKTALDRGVGSACSTSAHVQHFLRPFNLDLLSVIPKEAEPKWRRKTCQGKLAYAIHVLCELRVRYRAKPDEFVSVSYALLVPILGTRYTADSLQVLQDAGVIESDRRHVPGIKSRGYRFTTAYRTIVETFPPVEKTAVKSSAQQQARVKEAIGSNPNYAFIFECLKSLSFSDETEAFLTSAEVEESARASLRLSYENMRRGRFEFSTDSKTGRVFHNVANMAKPLRRHLRLDGEPCHEIDLANAQPLLLVSLYPSTPEAKAERLRFSSFVGGGLFYERLNHIAGQSYSADDRDKLKRAFQQQILSGKNHYTGKLKTAFSTAFPILSEIIAHAKRDDHTALSLRLQRVESELVTSRVVSRLRQEHPGTKVVTIHDAILCAASRTSVVTRVFSEETRSLLGVTPNLHITPTQSNVRTYQRDERPAC